MYDVAKTNGCLRFELQGYAKEDEHLSMRDGNDDYSEMIEVLKLQRDGKTVREIALILDMSKSTVQRRLTTARQNNVTIPDEKENSVPDVPSVPRVGQTVQAGQVTELRLPYKEKEEFDEL